MKKVYRKMKRLPLLSQPAQQALPEPVDTYNWCYQKIVEFIQEAIVMHKCGRIIYANPAFLALFGYETEAIIGMPILDVIAPQDRAQVAQYILYRESGGEVPVCYEIKLLHASGTEFYGEVVASAFSIKDDLVFIASARDITARKRMAAELEASKLETEMQNAKMTAIFDSTTDFIWSVDRDFNVLYCNQAVIDHHLENYGVDPRDEVRLRQVMPPELFRFWEERYRQVLANGRLITEHYADRGDKIFEGTLNPINVNGETVAIAVYLRALLRANRRKWP